MTPGSAYSAPHPKPRALFVPVLPRPSGDRYATFAVYEVLRERRDDGFAVAHAPVEAYDDTGNLKTTAAIAAEIDALVKAEALTHPYRAVAFYTGSALIAHLKELETAKFATTHLHPLELAHTLSGGDYDGENWNDRSLQHAFGLDMLACPAHMADYHKAGGRSTHIINDPNVLWVFGVSAQRAPTDVDLSADALLRDAHTAPVFVISLPTPALPTDAVTDDDMIGLLVRLIHHEETSGERTVLLVDNPRSAHLKNMLLDRLGRDYPVVSDKGAFTERVLPAVKKHPLSKVFLPGDSASVMTECVETLKWHHIIVNGHVVKDDEQRKMVPFFFDNGRIQVLDADGRILKPENPSETPSHAAFDIAQAAIDRFVQHNTNAFQRPAYLRVF